MPSRKPFKTADDVNTQFEKYTIENGKNLTYVAFGTGKSMRAGDLRRFYNPKCSSLSECSYNTVMSICRLLNCEPEDILEPNEINGVYGDINSFLALMVQMERMMEEYPTKDIQRYFQVFLRRTDVTVAWISKYPSGRVVFRIGRFTVKDNYLIDGQVYEFAFNSDLSNIEKLYTKHRGVEFLTPALYYDKQQKVKNEVGGENFDPGTESSENSELKVGDSDFDPGMEESGPVVVYEGKSFTFREVEPGVLLTNKPIKFLKNMKVWGKLDSLELKPVPHDELTKQFSDFLTDIYNCENFTELTHAEFMDRIFSCASPFKNRLMVKRFKEKRKDKEDK